MQKGFGKLDASVGALRESFLNAERIDFGILKGAGQDGGGPGQVARGSGGATRSCLKSRVVAGGGGQEPVTG
ncbi:hypothetical protein, partial [Burkholderia gladioli]|uniref:hypothetical protein n=1 Tax=Burkholderia gladioli TaxID=28095 RepID=UPI0039EC7A8F